MSTLVAPGGPVLADAPPDLEQVQVCQPRTPYEPWRGRRRPAEWPLVDPRTGWVVGEVWRTGETFVTYIRGKGVRRGTESDSIAGALAAVGWTQVGWPTTSSNDRKAG